MRKSERFYGKKLHEGRHSRHTSGYVLSANKTSLAGSSTRDVPDGSDDPKPPPKNPEQ